jgi:peptidyl-prolyl cis-trans isomerase SurA
VKNKLNFYILSIFLILLANVYSYTQPLTSSAGVVIDKIIAKIDKQIVLKSEYDMLYLQMLTTSKDFDLKLTPCRVLEQIVTNKVLLARAEADSIDVEDKQVEAEMNRRMDYFISQIGSKEKLEAYYKKSVTQLKAELRKQVKEQMLIQKMQETITGKMKVSPGEVKKYFNEIPKDSLPYFSKEVEVGHIVKLPIINRDQKKLAREKLSRIRDLIVNDGESFMRLAAEYSEDPGSARQGGELGFFNKGDLVPEYEAAALKLKPGEISPVIESIFGFHLIQMIERRGNQYNTRHILIKPQSSVSDLEGAAIFLDSLRKKILSDSLSFAKAAKEYSDDQATKENGGMIPDPTGMGGTKIAIENLDPALFFVIDTMKPNQISAPLPYRTEDGKDAYRIIYLKSETPPHQANLKDDYQKIQFAALEEKKNKAINNWFKKVKNEIYIEVDSEFHQCELFKNLN